MEGVCDTVKFIVMSVSKISTQRRKAIYEAYAKKCFYCGQHIDWDNLEIDHLIAEQTCKDLSKVEYSPVVKKLYKYNNAFF